MSLKNIVFLVLCIAVTNVICLKISARTTTLPASGQQGNVFVHELNQNFTATVSGLGIWTGIFADGTYTFYTVNDTYIPFYVPFGNQSNANSLKVYFQKPLPTNEIQIFFVQNTNPNRTKNYVKVYTPFGCVATKVGNACSQVTVGETAVNFDEMVHLNLTESAYGLYRFEFDEADDLTKPFVQLYDESTYHFWGYLDATGSSTQWNIFELLVCSWGKTYKTINTLETVTPTFPWAFNDCDYEPITVTGSVTSNSISLSGAQITFTSVTNYSSPVTVNSGAGGSFSANLHTTLYDYEVVLDGYHNYNGQVNFTSSMKILDIILEKIITTTGTTAAPVTTGTTGVVTSTGSVTTTGAVSTTGSETTTGTTAEVTTGNNGTETSTGESTTGQGTTGLSTTGSSTTGSSDSSAVALTLGALCYLAVVLSVML